MPERRLAKTTPGGQYFGYQRNEAVPNLLANQMDAAHLHLYPLPFQYLQMVRIWTLPPFRP
jgi:hypothetical protein